MNFLPARILAAVSVVCGLAAIVVWPVEGLPVASVCLAGCALLAAVMSRDAAQRIRRHRAELVQLSRTLTLQTAALHRARVGLDDAAATLQQQARIVEFARHLIDPPRVSADPAVSLLARIQTTPDSQNVA